MLDGFQYPDLFGLAALQKEPAGTAGLDDLKRRPSRRLSLEQLIGQYAVFGPARLRKTLTKLLQQAAARLGSPNAQSDLGDPALMAVHALNLVHPRNWAEVSVERDNGMTATARQYVPPQAERQHLDALQEASRDRFSQTNMEAAIGLALDDPSRSSPEFAAAAVVWAQRTPASGAARDAADEGMREQAVLTAAMIAMRDGDVELRTQHRAWADVMFAQALRTQEDPVHRFRAGLRFNPMAIAFVGMIHSLKDGATPDHIRAILEVAARDNPATAHGFGAAASTLAAIDERLPRAILRCAFAAAIRPTREWNLPEKKVAARANRHRRRVQAAVRAEVAWLAGKRSQPEWPAFPPISARARHRRFLLGPEPREATPRRRRAPPEEYTDHQAAALWLGKAAVLADITARPWLRELVQTYVQWTAAANGAGLAQDEETDTPGEWNGAYFGLLPYCLPGLAPQDLLDEIALTRIASLSDEPFFDVVTLFLRGLDFVFFNDHGLQAEEVVRIRSILARRLIASNGWHRQARSPSASVEVHIGPAIAAFFFNDHNRFLPTKCYLLPKAIDRLDPFLPLLETLVEKGPSFFTALITLNLLQVSPKPAHLPFIIMAAKTWLRSYSDSTAFWIDNEVGRRTCLLIDDIWRKEPALFDRAAALRDDVDQLLAALVRIGAADAARLEQALLGASTSDG